MNVAQIVVLSAVFSVAAFLGQKRLLCDVRKATGFCRQRFDAVVLSCQADGYARLSRADLPELLPPGAEAESLIAVETERYHFVEVTE